MPRNVWRFSRVALEKFFFRLRSLDGSVYRKRSTIAMISEALAACRKNLFKMRFFERGFSPRDSSKRFFRRFAIIIVCRQTISTNSHFLDLFKIFDSKVSISISKLNFRLDARSLCITDDLRRFKDSTTWPALSRLQCIAWWFVAEKSSSQKRRLIASKLIHLKFKF